MNMNLGKYKVWLQRLQSYLGLFNFMMIGVLFLKDTPFGIPWYLFVIAGAVGVPILMYIDLKIIFPQMAEYQFNKNPEMKKLRKEIAEIKKLLK